MAAAVSKRQGARAHAELQFLLRLGGDERDDDFASRRSDCNLSAAVGRSFGMVVGSVEAGSIRLRGSGLVAGVADRRGNGNRWLVIEPVIGPHRGILVRQGGADRRGESSF